MKKLGWLILPLTLALAAVFASCSAPAASSTTPAGGGTGAAPPGGLIGNARSAASGLEASYLAAASSQQVGIWVTGSGKVSVTPDLALLSLGIEAQAKTVAEAQAEASKAMKAVVDALKAAGVENKDIQTKHFSITPITRWVETYEYGGRSSKPVLEGYKVSNMVSAKIHALDKAGSIIDAATAAGSDLIRVQGISFTIEDPKPFQRQAREQALKEAISKAQQMAEVTGVKLGKPVHITESTPAVPGRYLEGGVFLTAKADNDTSVTPISAGELEVQVSVQMVFDLS